MRLLCLLAVSIAAFGQPAALLQRSIEQQLASAERQRESARIQAESIQNPPPAPARVPSAPAVTAPCDPLPETLLTPLVESAAQQHHLAPRLLRAVIEQESAFHPCAVSPKGARGLMQLMPSTAEQFAVQDAFDPSQNVATGAKYLRQLLDRFDGDLSLALSAYNAGPAAVDQAHGIPSIPETRDYVQSVLTRAGIKQPAQPRTPKPKPTEN
jgi:soluble lytic murein transglycosylase-like protein